MTAQVLTAAGESWQWQLRDAEGQWIEMGSRVQWLMRGIAQIGTVIGSPKEGLALVQMSDGSERRVATRWLTKTDDAAPQILPSRGAAVVAANDGVLDMVNGREYFYTRFNTDLYGIRKKGPTAKQAAVQAVNDQMDVPGDQLKILADLAFPRKFSHIDPEDLQPIVINELIAQWAETASDSSSLSIALQEAARREFNIPGTTDYRSVSSDVEARVQLILDSSEDVLRAFVRAQHKATVGQLKADGVKTLRLARGTLEAMDTGEQTVRLRPMSSFTVSTHTAWMFATRIGPSYRFGTSPRVTFIEVPVDKILAVPGTGAGCLDEYEFILMGGDYPAIVTEAEKHNPKSVVPPELLPIAASGGTPIELDTPGIGEDWIKTLSWDLSTDPDDFTQAQLQRLSTLPAWEAAPPQIKAALRRGRGLLAAGNSWRWQLRDSEGQWIEMGSEVKWLARGRWLYGIVVGSPAPGVATVEEVLTAIRHDIPSARLEVVEQGAALVELVDAVRNEKGRIDWKALNLPRDAATAVIQKAADQKVERQDQREKYARQMGKRVKEWLASDKPPWTDPEGIRAGKYSGITIDRAATVKGQSPTAGRYDPETGDFIITEMGLEGDERNDDWRKSLILHEAGHALQMRIFDDIGWADTEKDVLFDSIRRPKPVTFQNRNGVNAKTTLESPFEEEGHRPGHHDEPKEILADAIAIIAGGTSYQHAGNPKAVAFLNAVAEHMDKNGWEHPPLFEKPPLPEWTNWRKGTTPSGDPEWVSRPDGNEVTIRKMYGGGGYRIVATNHQGAEDVYRSGEAKTLAEAKKKGLELLAAIATERKDAAKGNVAAGDLKPGSVYTQRRNRDRVRVLRMHPPEESSPDYVTFDGVILDGPGAGSATLVTMKRALQLINESDTPEKQDFDRDVLAPAKALLEGMKTKYPDGLAMAVHAALMPGEDTTPEPDMSPRLKELGRTVEVVRWQADEAEAKARARELIEEIAHAPASQMLSLGTKIDAAEEKVRQLAAWRVGGVVAEYADLLREHQTAHREWQQRSITTSNKITPHSDGAKRIMADIREVGRMVRVGIDIDILERGTPSPSPERDKLEAEREDLRKQRDALFAERARGTSSEDARTTLRINNLLLPINARIRDVEKALNAIPDDSVDSEFRDQVMDTNLKQRFTEYKRRRELARRAVAELVGVTTETKQTWGPPTKAMPKLDPLYGENLGDLDAEQKAAMTQMLLNYPASWVERFDERVHTTSMGTRGWNDGTHIVISNKDGKGLSAGHNAMYATITHEQGHSMENLVPGLKGLEAMFWHDRLGENSPKELYGDDGAYFPHRSSAEHVGNLDRPTSIDYTLKTYGNVYSVFIPNWEVFTTGVQEVLGDGKDLYTRAGTDDKDLWEWTMGTLLMLDGRSAFTGEGA